MEEQEQKMIVYLLIDYIMDQKIILDTCYAFNDKQAQFIFSEKGFETGFVISGDDYFHEVEPIIEAKDYF